MVQSEGIPRKLVKQVSDDMTDTAELELTPVRARGRASRWWRGFTGSLAAGLAVLAVLVLAAGALCAVQDFPGPGAEAMIAHPVAAALALPAQRVADRKDGPVAAAAGVLVVVILVVALWTFWWS